MKSALLLSQFIQLFVPFGIGQSQQRNFVTKPSNGWYCKVDQETGELIEPKCREKDTLNGDFWKSIFANPAFSEFVESKYKAPDSLAVDYGDEPEDVGDE